RRVRRAQALLARLARGDLPVQREDDGVDERGLARTRRPLEQEQTAGPERREVDRVPPRARTERLDRQRVQVHQALRSAASTSSYAWRSTAASASVGRAPVTCATNSAATSSGSCAAVTATDGVAGRDAGRCSTARTCGNRARTRACR